MVTICHDPSLANTLFTKHTLNGAAIQGAERESHRPRFSDGQLDELYYGFNPDYYYKKVLNRSDALIALMANACKITICVGDIGEGSEFVSILCKTGFAQPFVWQFFFTLFWVDDLFFFSFSAENTRKFIQKCGR